MFTTPSRAQPLGGAWLSAVVPATGDPARGPPQLEFTVANGGAPTRKSNRSVIKDGYDCLHAEQRGPIWRVVALWC